MLSGKHCSNNKNNTAITALHQQWPQNKSQTHQPVSGLPPTHQMHTMPPHPLCLKQLRQRAGKVIFKTLSQHLTSHCFPHFCTDPNVNSKHLRVICWATGRENFWGGGPWVTNTCVSLRTDQLLTCGVELRRYDAAATPPPSSLHLQMTQRKHTESDNSPAGSTHPLRLQY